MTVRGGLVPYHDPVTAHRDHWIGDLLFSVLEFRRATNEWPTTESDIASPDLEEYKKICGGYLKFHPNKDSCGFEFNTILNDRHYAYTLLVRDSDNSEDYLFGGKLNPHYNLHFHG